MQLWNEHLARLRFKKRLKKSAFRLHSLENKDVEEVYQFLGKGTKVEIIR